VSTVHSLSFGTVRLELSFSTSASALLSEQWIVSDNVAGLSKDRKPLEDCAPCGVIFVEYCGSTAPGKGGKSVGSLRLRCNREDCTFGSSVALGTF
jgi:hypothetical protein